MDASLIESLSGIGDCCLHVIMLYLLLQNYKVISKDKK